MIRENPVVKKMLATGEEQVAKITSQLLSNEKVMGAVQSILGKTLEAKGLVEKNLHAALASFHIPTRDDVRKLESKLEELERHLHQMAERIEKGAEH